MKEWLAYAVAWSVLKVVGLMPRSLARATGAAVAGLLLTLSPKLRKTAEFHLRLAFPDSGDAKRQDTPPAMARSLGRMAAEFARMPRYSRQNIEDVIVLDGHENFLE